MGHRMRSRFLGAVCAGLLTVFSTLSHAVILPLELRLGGLAYYDPNLDVTWAADANMNGLMTWYEASSWVSGLNIGGVGGWRLPSMNLNGDLFAANCFDGGVAGCDANELGYLYWEEGITSATPAPFANLLAGGPYQSYWSSTQLDPAFIAGGGVYYESMNFGDGLIGASAAENPGLAWAVRDGDISSVPVPAAVWLFGSGILGLMGVARKKPA